MGLFTLYFQTTMAGKPFGTAIIKTLADELKTTKVIIDYLLSINQSEMARVQQKSKKKDKILIFERLSDPHFIEQM